MHIAPVERVGILLQMVPPGVNAVARLMCLNCDVPMAWDEASVMWICEDCEQELTVPEAQELVDYADTALTSMQVQIETRAQSGGFLWALAKCWRKLRTMLRSSRSRSESTVE
jgi:hypothetical protein